MSATLTPRILVLPVPAGGLGAAGVVAGRRSWVQALISSASSSWGTAKTNLQISPILGARAAAPSVYP